MLSSIARLNGRLRVSTRIFGGFAIVLLLLCALATVSVVEFRTIGGAVDQSQSIASNALLGSEIRSDFADARREVLRYIDTGNEASRDRARALFGDLNAKTERMVGQFRSEERAALGREIAALLKQYEENFARIVPTRETRTAVVTQRMDVVGLRMREDLTAVVEAAIARSDLAVAARGGVAQQYVGLLRLEANRLLLSPTAELLARFNDRVASALREIEATVELSADAAEQAKLRAIAVSIGTYKEAVGEGARAQAELDRLVDEVGAPIAERTNATIVRLLEQQQRAVAETNGEVDSTITATTQLMLGLGAGAIALGLLLAWTIGRGIVGPVTRMTGAMTELASGRLETQVPALENRDEIGSMAKAVQVFKDNAIAVRRMEEEAKAAAIAAEEEKKAALRKLADEFEAAVGGVVDGVSAAATEMQGSARSLSSTAELTARQATTVSAATEQASANVQTVASATEELASSVQEISRQVVSSTAIANRAVAQAGETDGKMQGLSAAAQQIGDVVRLIGDIAGQTNLLALNATIEAARAGEAGKGFAVVAAEVKNLATQTAKATEEIGRKVGEMQGVTAESVAAIRSIGETITEMSAIASSIASAVEEQGAATQEIARNVQEAARGTQDVATNIAGVTEASSETGAAASQMLGAAGELSEQSARLKREVEGFLATVRAA
ncbi:HAMP domain-containing methyl-accepting chemotaxis protein [Elioraea rosea]|uniref:HAMP domain-containing methyl-accepting chemotaxis protein n=1 Tax=Elioraea rosea TaxID=2492390 RepID=UPI0013157C43|nr:methyl-accepting chemotaxis protein [Elioraea rosea]